MESVIVDQTTTYWLPANNDDVMSLVEEAATKGEIICVRGSGHSFPMIGNLEKEQTSSSGKPYKYIMLSNMNAVKMVDQNTVWVQAGCHLGYDPFDQTPADSPFKSTLENSLCYQLDSLGTPNAPAPYNSPPFVPSALPDLGGITHQTVGGFLSTASSGGSTTYSFEDSLLSIDIITWDGQKAYLKTFTRPDPAKPDPDDPFYGAGVATMGLLGIIVSATFSCSPQYYIKGSETIGFADKCTLIDIFDTKNGLPTLQSFFETTEYTRLFWWPQHNQLFPDKDLSRIVVWQAARTDQDGALAWAKAAYDKMDPPPKIPADGLKPYQEVPYLGLGTPIPATLGADLIFTAIGTWPNWLHDLLAADPVKYEFIKAAVETAYPSVIFPAIVDIFVMNNDDKNPPQQFSDTWYDGLPMDNQMSDKLMPIWFTELWISIDQTQQVINTLKAFYDSQETTIDFSFNCEIYAAKSNDFWLSPSYKQDVIRIDILWFANNLSDPATFYQNFWDLLAPFNYRAHWAKYLPDVVNLTTTDKDNKKTTVAIPGPQYLTSKYPKWANWKALREQMDPSQIFLNDYWRQHLPL